MLHCVTNLNAAFCAWHLLNAPIKVNGAVPHPYVRCLACSCGGVFQCTIPLWFGKKKDVREIAIWPLEHLQTMAQPHLKAIHHWLLFRGSVKSAAYVKRALKCNSVHLYHSSPSSKHPPTSLLLTSSSQLAARPIHALCFPMKTVHTSTYSEASYEWIRARPGIFW